MKENQNKVYEYIHETPQRVREILLRRKEVVGDYPKIFAARKPEQIYILGSGTSYNAGLAVKSFLESILKIKVFVQYPTLYRDMENVYNRNTEVWAVSQNGSSTSTADGLDKARAQGFPTLALLGDMPSVMMEHADRCIHILCGEERAQKTKGYHCSIVTLWVLGLELALGCGTISQGEYDGHIAQLERTVENMPGIIEASEEWYERNYEEFLTARRVIITGYEANLANVLESSLKVIELVHIGSEGYEVEEFMHGIYHSIFADTFMIYIASPGKLRERILRLRDYEAARTQHSFVVMGGKYPAATPRDFVYPFVDSPVFSVLEYALPLEILCAMLPADLGFDPIATVDRNFHRSMASKIYR